MCRFRITYHIMFVFIFRWKIFPNFIGKNDDDKRTIVVFAFRFDSLFDIYDADFSLWPYLNFNFISFGSALHTHREQASEWERERGWQREGGWERGCTHRLLYSTNEWQASDTRTSNVSEKWNEKLSGFVLEIGLWQKGNCRQSKTVEWSHLAHALSYAICEWAEHTTW